MIVYFDTSSIVPLLISEPASERCRRLWDDADRVVTSRVGYVEAAAALAQATRLERVTTSVHREALRALDELWTAMVVIELDAVLMRRAAQIAALHALRGYDAVHCAAAELIADESVVAASGDQDLLRAWRALGLAVSDTNA